MRIRELFSRPRKAPVTKPGRRPRPLVLETMEDRCVPSILFGDAPGLTVSDNNGPVLSNAQVRLIFWGNGWNSGVGPALRTQVQTAVDTLNASTYFYSPLPGADLSQYRAGSQSRPTRVASFTDTYNSPGTTFTSNDVFTMLQHEFGMTPNYYYYVIPDPNSTPTGCGCTAEHTYWFQGSNREYYGFSRNLATPSLDDLTVLYSHEMAESITDPDGTALQVNPRGTSGWNEIADGEAQGYSYRVSGILAQSYWSRANAKFTVPTGQTQNFLVSHSHVLTVNGDQLASPNDNITLDVSGGGVRVTLNGEVAQFEPGAISGIVVNSGAGTDTINVLRTLAAAPVTISSTGTATVNVGVGGNVQAIQGAVTITNPPSFTTVNVDDSADSGNRTATLDTATIGGSPYGRLSGLAPAQVLFKYNDTNTATIQTGTGTEIINVLATGKPTTILAHSSATTVNVGNGSVQNIAAVLTLRNPPAFSTINIDDSADTIARTVTHSTVTFSGDPYGQVAGLAPAPILYRYGDTTAVTVQTGTGGATVDVQATGKPLTLVGHADGTVNVGSAGSVQGILAQLTLENPPAYTTLNVDDSADTLARSATLDSTTVSFTQYGRITGLAPASILYKVGDTNAVTVTGGSGGNTFNVGFTTGQSATTLNPGTAYDAVNVRGTDAALVVNTGAYDSVSITNAAATLDGIGAVTVNDATGTSAVTLDDSGFGGTEDYVITYAGVGIVRSSAFGLSYNGIGALVLFGGPGSDTFDIDSTATYTAVYAGAGGNCFHVSPYSQWLAGSLGGYLDLYGGGNDVLDFFDANDPNAETFSFDPAPSSLTLGSTGTTVVGFTGMGGGVYVVTNGFSTPDDQSGTVIFDPDGGPPCIAGTGSSSRGRVADPDHAPEAVQVQASSRAGSSAASEREPAIVKGRPAQQPLDVTDLLDRTFSLWS